MDQLKLSKVFNDSVSKYLDERKPRFDIGFQKFVLQMVESEVRDYFARELGNIGCNVRKEAFYPNSNLRCDILASLNGQNIYIEIKQSAKWSDSVQQKDLSDFDKLKKLSRNVPSNNIMALFVININPKYDRFPKDWELFITPLHLPCRNIGLKALSKFWKNSIDDNDKKYFRFFLKEYMYPVSEDLNNYWITYQYKPPVRFNCITLCYVNDINFL